VPIHIAGSGTLGASTTSVGAPFHHYFMLTVQSNDESALAMHVASRILRTDRAGWKSEPSLSASVPLRTP
jgi:hypothetical protein